MSAPVSAAALLSAAALCSNNGTASVAMKSFTQLLLHVLQPQTEKMHAIIERTASFIAQHGVQMEIMMKAKQKDNAHFSFLNYEDELNAYYKHVLNAIKQSKYTPASALHTTSADGKCCFAP